ncbi:MAG: hypothetical protein ABH986_06175 [archaeon]
MKTVKVILSPEAEEVYNYLNKESVLFRVELPSYWRMLYSLTDGETKIEIIAFVLDLIDHPTYNKKFGYKKR